LFRFLSAAEEQNRNEKNKKDQWQLHRITLIHGKMKVAELKKLYNLRFQYRFNRQ